jgi:hypothetical protein
MGGYGSTIGGLAGTVGGAYFGPVGSMVGGAAGSALGSQFDKSGSKPRQTPTQMGVYDPYAQFGPQLGAIESVLGPRMRGTAQGQVSNPYVGPGPEQQQALAALANFQSQATPAFGAGLGQLQGTVGGQYLDVAQRPEFQRLSAARQQIARDLFGQASDVISGGAAARGAYNSSARQAQQLREANRLYNQAAQDIAQAGWGQYGAERGYQENATARALGLAPGLAEQTFRSGEQLRAAQQAGGATALEARLRAAGVDEATMRTVLQYMQLRGLRPVQPIVGSTPEEEATARMGFLGPMLGGMGKGGGLSSMFGSGGSSYGGTVYAPSSGWATPRYQE